MTNVTVLNPILDIPANDVGSIVQKFVDYDHVTKIEIVKQPDGKFTVVPTKSD